MLSTLLVLAALGGSGPTATRDAIVVPAAHWSFDSTVDAPAPGVEVVNAPAAPENAGTPVGAGAENRGSLAFDGQNSLVRINLAATDPKLITADAFTWEGFFYTPGDNEVTTDGGVSDRLVTQFSDDVGRATRWAVGLAAAKKGEGPRLCLSLQGTEARHVGKTLVATDAWHHFAVVYDRRITAASAQDSNQGRGEIIWYLDYEECGRVTLTGDSPKTKFHPAGKAPIAVGGRLIEEGKVDRGFTGKIDELRFTPVALGPERFQRLKAAQFAQPVTIEFFDRLPDGFAWDFARLSAVESWNVEGFGLGAWPATFTHKGVVAPASGAQAVRLTRTLTLPAGKHRFLLRTPHDARLVIDDALAIDARSRLADHPLPPLDAGPRDYVVEQTLAAGEHKFELQLYRRADADAKTPGEVLVAASQDKGDWKLLGTEPALPLDAGRWGAYLTRARLHELDVFETRQTAAIERGRAVWDRRHEWAKSRAAEWPEVVPPAAGHPVDAFVNAKLAARGETPGRIVDDATFLRRATLDLAGRIPTLAEADEFLNDARPDKRERLIDRLLQSPEWADSWVGYWQDVFAENPSILKPTLNNSGPFRRWIHESLANNLPLDQFATELILMEGADDLGGTEGFAIATDNDVPMALKAQVVSKAFLAAEMKCARCHDSPSNMFSQRDLFSLASMLSEKPIKVPATSTVIVPPGGRKPAVTSDLKANESVTPDWPFAEFFHETNDPSLPPDVSSSDRPRKRLAAYVTSPERSRFTDVIANRVWKRYFGVALIEPVEHWESLDEASHPELVRYLSRRLVDSGYDLKALARLLLTSETYQRETARRPGNSSASDRTYAFAAPRRVAAEQLVDSCYLAVGKGFDAEELNFDPKGTQGFLNLGVPQRAWQLASLSNERDRPALSLPVNQMLVDVMTMFGWRETRREPVTEREEEPNPLQPLMLGNGDMMQRVIRLTEDSAITDLCLQDQPVEELARKLFRTTLTREPTAGELKILADALRPGYESRLTGQEKPPAVAKKKYAVDWDKHLEAHASVELMEAERLAREGDPPTVRLTADFRERAEDVLWALLNSPEFVFVP